MHRDQKLFLTVAHRAVHRGYWGVCIQCWLWKFKLSLWL